MGEAVAGPWAGLSHDAVVAAAESLVGAAALRAAEAEELRRIPEATMKAVADSGMLAAMVPSRYGGPGLGLRTACEVSRVLAHGCPSTAWVVGFLVEHNWQFARFGQAAQDEIFGRQAYIAAPAQLQPAGRMEPIAGGYRVSGRWRFCSAALHSDWAILAGVVAGADGAHAATVFIAPASELEVDDDWHTSGMRGTGSVTLVADGVLVPEHRTTPLRRFVTEDNEGAALHAEPVVGYPLGPSLSLFAASISIGAAQRAVELFREQLGARTLYGTMGDVMQSRPRSLARLADATIALRTAELLWTDGLDLLCATADRGDRLDTRQRTLTRLLAGKAVLAARDAITTVCDGAGASVYYSESPLQRLQRDVETMKGHVVFDTDRSTVSFAEADLGLALTDPF